MSASQKKSFNAPDETRSLPHVKMESVNFGDMTIVRAVWQPGWRWSEHMRRVAGTESCQGTHFTYIISGHLRTRMDDGTEFDIGPGDIAITAPGHDAWVLGDEPCVGLDFQGASRNVQASNMRGDQNMRVLVSCISAHGHLQPLLPLLKALSDAGHEVAIATGSSLQTRARATGFTTFEAGIDAQAAFERLAEVFPDQEYNRLAPDEILDWYIPHLFGEILAPAMLADLEPLAQRWRADVILHDIWELAAPIAAAHLGIPSVSQALGIRFSNSMLEAAAKAVAPLWQQCKLEPDPTAGIYRHLCLDITPPTLQPYEPAPYYDAIRPLRPIAPPPIPGEQLPAWIEQRQAVPLVHMTLGTNFGTNSDLSMFRSVIVGLGNLDMDVAITIGFEVAPTTFKPLPDNVHIESYLPHSLLLPHCAAVICHGGPGTTLSALALGLPLLILPQGADQYIVGDLVQRAGAGLRLVPSEVDPSSIRSSVLALLNERTYQAGARRLQREIAAMPGPDEAVHLIEEVVYAQL